MQLSPRAWGVPGYHFCIDFWNNGARVQLSENTPQLLSCDEREWQTQLINLPVHLINGLTSAWRKPQCLMSNAQVTKQWFQSLRKGWPPLNRYLGRTHLPGNASHLTKPESLLTVSIKSYDEKTTPSSMSLQWNNNSCMCCGIAKWITT